MNDYIKFYNKVIPLQKTAFITISGLIQALIEIVTLVMTAFFIKLISSSPVGELTSLNTSFKQLDVIIKLFDIKLFLIMYLIAIIFKYIYSLFYCKIIYNEIYNVQLKLNNLLVKNIFNQNYKRLKEEKFQRTKNIFYKEIDYSITYFISPLLLLISDIFHLLFLTLSLILFLPKSFYAFFIILFILIYLINKYVKALVVVNSTELTSHQRNRTLILGNFYSNILYWRAKNIFKSLAEYFQKENEHIIKASYKLNFFQQIPRLTFEFLIYLTFCFLVLININNSDDYFFDLVIIGLSAIRFLPSIVKISSFLQSAVSAKTVIQDINLILDKKDSTEKKDKFILRDFNSKLELRDAGFNYGSKQILKNCNFTLNKNDIISITGSSGDGKSTLLEVLLRELDLTHGQLFFDGMDITKKEVDFSKIIGVVPQTIQFNHDTLRANLMFGISEDISDKYLNEILDKCNLTEFVKNLPNGLETVIDNNSNSLSGGECQRVAIARCLLEKNVKILIFDEITSALDNKNTGRLLTNIMEFKNQYTIIFITHNNIIRDYCNINYELRDMKLMPI